MSDLIKVPEWFDKICKYVQRDYGDVSVTKMKLMQAVMLQGWGSNFIEKIIKDDGLFLTESTTEYIQEVDGQEDIALYVLKHKDDLIKALIDGYEVEENKYIVVAKYSHRVIEGRAVDSDGYTCEEGMVFVNTPMRKIYYENNKYEEDYIEIYENTFSSDLVAEGLSPETLSLLHEKPELVMNKESAEKLINSYRIIIQIEI